VFLLHPATEEVVPFLARRSYSLATVFGLGAVIQCYEALREGRGAGGLLLRSGAAAILLALGLLANEAAVGVVPMALAAIWLGARTHRAGWRRSLLAGSLPLAALIAVLVMRARVVAGVGGYELPGESVPRFLSVLLASWRDLGAFQMSFGTSAPGYSLWRIGILAIAASYYLARVWQDAWIALGRKRPSLLLLLFGWLLGYSLLYASLEVWFPRQAYSMLPAFAMFLIACLASSIRAARAQPLRLAVHLLPQVLFLGMLLADSPSVRGPQAMRVENWEQTQRLLLRLRADLASVPGRAVVHLVLPYREQQTRFNPLQPRPPQGEPPPLAQLPSQWLTTLLADRGIEVESFLFIRSQDSAGRFRVERDSGRAAIVFDDEQTYYVQTPLALSRRVARPAETLWLVPPPPPPKTGAYVYVWDGQSGVLIDLRPADHGADQHGADGAQAGRENPLARPVGRRYSPVGHVPSRSACEASWAAGMRCAPVLPSAPHRRRPQREPPSLS
jgi:hypothetical protein